MAEYLEPKILYAGDSAVIVEFGDSIDMKTNAKVQQLRRYIECAQLGGIVEMVPTYRSLAVYFDPEGEPPFLIDAGMWVRFQSIAKEEYDEIAAKVAAREYKPEIFPKSGDAE